MVARGRFISDKDQEFVERIGNFFQNLFQVLPPLNNGSKSTNPFDVFQNVMDVFNKVVDGVTIGLENLPPYMAKILEINRDAQKAFIEGRYSDYIELKYKGTEIF